MAITKSTIHIPAITTNDDDTRRLVILQDDSHQVLNIEQAMFLKVVLESWLTNVTSKPSNECFLTGGISPFNP